MYELKLEIHMFATKSVFGWSTECEICWHPSIANTFVISCSHVFESLIIYFPRNLVQQETISYISHGSAEAFHVTIRLSVVLSIPFLDEYISVVIFGNELDINRRLFLARFAKPSPLVLC